MTDDPTLNPTIACTQKQLAWDAWLRACDVPTNGPDGERYTRAQQAAFATWWDRHGSDPARWASLREMIEAAWQTAPFASYWQMIVDAQPVVGK